MIVLQNLIDAERDGKIFNLKWEWKYNEIDGWYVDVSYKFYPAKPIKYCTFTAKSSNVSFDEIIGSINGNKT